MKDCWKENPVERPSVEVIMVQLSSMVVKDTRPIGSWGDFMPSQFQEAVGSNQYPSIEAFKAMLWGTPVTDGITT
jgi:hypothetical protein